MSPKVAKGIPKAPTRKSSRGSRAATYEEVPDVEEESDEASDEEQQEEGAWKSLLENSHPDVEIIT